MHLNKVQKTVIIGRSS